MTQPEKFWTAAPLEMWRRLVRGDIAARTQEIEGLLPADAFEEQLVLERARADRAGYSFVLVVFSFDYAPLPRDSALATRLLASVLFQRTRISDTKGWYKDHIAVIFPYTSRRDAPHVLQPIEEMFRQKVLESTPAAIPMLSLRYTLSEYPDDRRTWSAAGLRRSGHTTETRLSHAS